MTRGTAETLLKRYGFDDNDPLDDWLDAGVVEFENAHDWPFLQKVSAPAGLAGDNTIALASGAFKVQSLRDVTNKNKLQFKDITEFERVIEDPTVRGLALYYTLTGLTSVTFWPVLDSAVTWRVVYQEELTLPSALASDGTQMPGPARVHYAYVLAAAYIALQAESEEERAKTAQSQFEAAVTKHWSKYADSNLDEPGQVVDAMGYSDPAWRF